MLSLSKGERRRRIIDLVRKKEGMDCPEMVVERIEEAMSAVTVFYWCKEEEVEKVELLQSTVLTEDEAKHIGIDRTARGRPETRGY